MVAPLWIGYYALELLLGWRRGSYRAETTPGNAAYHPLWQPFLIGLGVADLVLLLGTLSLIVLFFKRKRAFSPTAMALAIVYLLVELATLGVWLEIPDTARQIDSTLLSDYVLEGAVIFVIIAYLARSERVRHTFIE